MFNQIKSTILLLLFFLLLPDFNYAESEILQPIIVEIIDVIDGDTVLIKNGEELQEIDIMWIDAPELNQPFGREAKAFIEKIIKNGIVAKIEHCPANIDYDPYLVLHGKSGDHQDYHIQMLMDGLAWVRYGYGVGMYSGQQWQAKQNKVGLWSEENPIPPWEWSR